MPRAGIFMADQPLIKVGGQAVVEGVMMRSPKSFAVAVRRANGQIVLRESPWRSLSERVGLLRWPFLRGSVVLLESMLNGISALNFSARIAISDEEEEQKKKKESEALESSESKPEVEPVKPEPATQDPEDNVPAVKNVSDWVIWGTVIFALGLGVTLFIALPHMAVWLGGELIGRELDVEDFLFHLIVGGVKLTVFLGYIALISLMKDVRRVFMFHGAEHQSIYTYEARQELIVENARRHSPLHPRCGTTFLIMVIGISILVFSLVFPFVIMVIGKPTGIGWLDQIIFIGIKLPLLFPIAGLAYEVQRLVSRYMDSWWAKALAWPGMLVQRMTTRPPTDDQLEVALASLRKALWREDVGLEAEEGLQEEVTVFRDFQTVIDKLGQKS
ncbi:MAG: DUF1385 domain-containing protein [Deltaproteobacteria bacterium]|nr:DUF1385 domain-containing protein [Deltaproteobacteria bacterium]